MHFRFRGNNIQVVRSQLDKATGKAKSVPVGSINRLTLAISDKLRASCSREEGAYAAGLAAARDLPPNLSEHESRAITGRPITRILESAWRGR